MELIRNLLPLLGLDFGELLSLFVNCIFMKQKWQFGQVPDFDIVTDIEEPKKLEWIDTMIRQCTIGNNIEMKVGGSLGLEYMRR